MDFGFDTWMRRRPGIEAGSNLELGLRLGGSASEEHLDRVATGLGASQARSWEEVAEVGAGAGSPSRIQAWVGRLDSRSGARIG
jgi:hypothetical protein